MNSSRRDFLKNSALAGAMLAVAAPQRLSAAAFPEKQSTDEGKGFTFLFQGDSITDGNRTRNNDWNHVMGHGYQFIIASQLWYNKPEKEFRFFNRGVSGNKVPDLAARWQQDTLDLKPDLLSFLVGINDTSAMINGDNSFSAERYEADYRALLEQTKKELPDIRFVLGDPFILPVGYVKDNWTRYAAETRKKQQIVKQLAAEFNAVHVEYQKAFDKALAKAPADYWIWDGIHPMPAGHELMAREWIKQVSKKLSFIR